jgi:hypothetical protein
LWRTLQRAGANFSSRSVVGRAFSPQPLFKRPLLFATGRHLRPAILHIRTAPLTSMRDARQRVDDLLDLGNPNLVFLQQTFVLSLGFFVFLWQMPETLHAPPQRFVTVSEPLPRDSSRKP